MTAPAATTPGKAGRRLGYNFSPFPENSVSETFERFGCTAAAALVLVVAERTLPVDPDSGPEYEITREELAEILRCTPANVDKAIEETATCFCADEGSEDGVIQFRRAGRKIALRLRDGRQSLCRLRSLPKKELKRIATREERETRKQAEEEARQAEIAAAVEQRIVAKAGELVCPQCGSEHTGLACQDCGAVTPIVRPGPEPQVVTPPVTPPPPPPKPAPKKPQSTTPGAGSNGAETTTPVVLLMLMNALRSVFLTSVGKRLDEQLARTICLGLGLKPAAPCSESDQALISEYILHFNRTDWKKHTSGYAGSGPFLTEVRETYEEKLRMPPGSADSPPLSVDERIRRARERLKKRGMA